MPLLKQLHHWKEWKQNRDLPIQPKALKLGWQDGYRTFYRRAAGMAAASAGAIGLTVTWQESRRNCERSWSTPATSSFIFQSLQLQRQGVS